MQMRYNTVPFESCIICLDAREKFVTRSDIIHLTFHVPWRLTDYSTMLIKGHGRPALESFWNLAFHLYYMPTFGPVFPKAPGAEFAQIAFY